MATFVTVQAGELHINMDHVVMVEAGTEPGTLAVTLADGRVTVLGGDQAERLRIWLRASSALPIVHFTSVEG